MPNSDFEKIIQDCVCSDENFSEVLSVVRANTHGKIWLIGGFIYRNIAAKLYGTVPVIKDYDFLVGELSEKEFVCPGWQVNFSTFGSPKLQKGKLSIDIVPLGRLFNVMNKGYEPVLDTYLKEVSLTVQSIAYDMEQKKLIGEQGIKALLTKTVAVHNKEMLSYYVAKKNLTLEAYIKDKADTLGFEWISESA